jgi:sporulation protein YlmC with PRC-barrel domain
MTAAPKDSNSPNAPDARDAPNAPRRIDVVLRVADHQIVGPEGELLGNVDDVELAEVDGRWLVTGLMVGPAALSQRLPGKLGAWTHAVWRRLHPAREPAPVVVPMEHVTDIGSAVTLDHWAALQLARTLGLELWLREFVVSRIPGAKGEPSAERPGDLVHSASSEASEPEEGRSESETALRPRPDGRPLSGLIGRPGLSPDGDQLGRLRDLWALGGPHDGHPGPLRLTHLQFTSHRLGAELGYSADPRQGPALVRAFFRGLHRNDRVVPISDLVAIDDTAGTIAVQTTHMRHPFDE